MIWEIPHHDGASGSPGKILNVPNDCPAALKVIKRADFSDLPCFI
jgi:hypothetical protein